MKKKCEECGTEFVTTKANVKYCSDVCRFQARRKKANIIQKKRYHEQKEKFDSFQKMM